ncbi:acid protease [Dacryopinax primogenitus]|uniref:Acid protease n=1 Tax=Dacryopinax primogenitus (strain DJM 731) TaxID=1858805 RepID=M5G2F7_DACPD|nr:acid protease [Dacryopinax primogenitus]EJU04396.1 acid protease [Dacryopinax primogenitus]
MICSIRLLTLFAALVTVTSAGPLEKRGLVTVPISKSAPSGHKALGHFERRRASEFLAGRYGKGISGYQAGTTASNTASNTSTSIGVANALDTYTMQVQVGTNKQSFNLLIDTGSSNTWVGAATKYKPSSSSKSTGDSITVSYGSGMFKGKEYLDTVSLGNGLVINQQSIGVATSSQGFEGVDGIIGIGPADLTEDTVSRTTTVPTVTDNLLSQGSIAQEVIGIYYAPTTENGAINGELTFGGVDTSKTTGAINYVPITETQPAGQYWGINQTISLGSTELLSAAGIVDTGTTLVLLATDVFDQYMQAIPGATIDQNSGLLEIPASQVNSLQTLNFQIGGVTYPFTAKDQVLDQALNTFYGGNASAFYSVVSDLGSPSGQGLDFINGYLFLERFYSVYDTTNNQVGFATTANS